MLPSAKRGVFKITAGPSFFTNRFGNGSCFVDDVDRTRGAQHLTALSPIGAPHRLSVLQNHVPPVCGFAFGPSPKPRRGFGALLWTPWAPHGAMAGGAEGRR
ncbi:MAG: hypothetical protein CM15mP18_2080 [Methanobacteriota archaeon]|nr:MAG: hypothetical protein CM15mP18_2080 [Euryarchaeota archaeon]